MDCFTDDVDTIGQMFSSTLVRLFSEASGTISILLLILYTSLILTLVTLVMIPVMMKAGGTVVEWGQKYSTAQQTSSGAVNGYIERTITGQKVIKVFCREDKAREELGIPNHDLRYNQIRAQPFGGIIGSVMNSLNQINYSLTACVGGLLCVPRGFDVGGLTVLLNLSRQLSHSISEISAQVSNVFLVLAEAEHVFSMVDEEPEPVDIMDCVVSSPMVSHVMSHHATFGYGPDKTILKNTNLHAKPGQKVAFIGSIGAGKTIITSPLNRSYNIRSGAVITDGTDIHHTSRDVLRNNITMVLQDTHLLIGTVWKNIRYGRLDAMDNEVVQVAKTTSAYSLTTRLSYGYGTMLEGDGASLGQGQGQLLNIARVAMSKAPVLILDETISPADTRVEKHIERGMDRLMTDRVIFIIACRPPTVRSTNVIMVLEHREITERGTYKELLEMKG